MNKWTKINEKLFPFTFTEKKKKMFYLYKKKKKHFPARLTGYMHYIKINIFYFVIYIECVCSPSFMAIHISKYRRLEKASWRINNVIKYIPYIVTWVYFV